MTEAYLLRYVSSAKRASKIRVDMTEAYLLRYVSSAKRASKI